MNDIIAASAMRCRTMADGSLRIEVEVEPKDATAAFNLFGRPGAPVAMAALKDGYDTKSDEPEPDLPKGGPLAKLAGQWCSTPAFQTWLKRAFPFTWTEVEGDTENVEPDLVAAEVIRRHCHIKSRAELDHDKRAADLFHAAIRAPYAATLS